MSDLINKRVLLGLSGGVDSAVSALLLQKKGCEVLAVTLLFSEENEKSLADARALATQLDLNHIAFRAYEKFSQTIIAPFAEAWTEARTPNPCIRCNALVKFPLLDKLAEKYDCDYVATGHYAAVVDEKSNDVSLSARNPDGDYYLKRAQDRKKDQSYFLYALPQDILKKTLFPLSKFSKKEVRKIAASEQIVLAEKSDSQEICFIKDNDRIGFLESHDAIGEPGPYLNTKGEVIGQHAGIGRYTIGQRKKLGQAFGKRMTILEIDAANNAIILGSEAECRSKMIRLGHITSSKRLRKLLHNGAANVSVQLRSQGQDLPCELEYLENNDEIIVHFPEERRLTAAGQSAVFYQDEIVLGGGIVMSSQLKFDKLI